MLTASTIATSTLATVAPNGHFQAVGHYDGVTAGPGPITIGSSTAGTYSLTSGVEILAL